MKKLLVLAALSMAAAPAMASKARLSALGNSEQLKDAQTVLTRPSDLVGMGNWATVELGATSSTVASTYYTDTVTNGTAQAEGGFAHAMSNGYLGFYMGHHNSFETTARNLASTAITSTLTEENPIDVYYASKAGDITWGAGLWYSNSDKKATSLKQSSMGLRAGAEMAGFDAYINLGLVGSFEDSATAGTNKKYTNTTPMKLGLGYTMGNMYFFGSAEMFKAKAEVGSATTKLEASNVKVGFVNSMKSEGTNFFYGVAYNDYNQGQGATALDINTMPFWMGLEHDAASWLTVRGSVTQNVLLSSSKTGSAEVNTVDHNTSAAAGVGIKFNKLTLDASIAKAFSTTAKAGDINGNNLMSNASLTYMF